MLSEKMTKAEILEKALEYELRVDELEAAAKSIEAEAKAAAKAQPKTAKPAPEPEEGVVMVIHLGGAYWSNNERSIVRCTPSGELSDAWMVVVGGRLLLNDGKQSIPARPFHQLATALKRRAQWSKAAAIKAATGA